MEDEDVDCVTKVDTVSNKVDNKIPCISELKGVNDVSERIAGSASEKGISERDFLKLKNVANCQEEEVGDKVNSDVTEVTVAGPKKVNGDLRKSESDISEENSSDCWKTNETINVELKSKEPPSNETDRPLKRKYLSIENSEELNQIDESEPKTSQSLSPIEFRGFKKRKLSEDEENKKIIAVENEKPVVEEEKETIISVEGNNSDEEEKTVAFEPVKPKVELRRSARNANMAKKRCSEQPVEQKEENGDQLTEYAQYLGLQPTVKFKCGRCGEKHFQSMASLNAHQKICSKSGSNALIKPTKPPGDSNLSTNFRITRKVYLCSACGTYYENWKLFLHMRDMHKRHICLFCLGMFSIAEKLAEHLLFKHNVHEKICKSPEEFLNLFKGSCYLTCCTCEKMFTEREDFFDHQCKDLISAPSTSNKDISFPISKDLTQRCNLCGILCGHFQSCPNVHNSKLSNAVTPSTSANSVNSSSASNINLTKFYVPVPASVKKEWNNKSVQTSTKAISSDKDDYFDLGNAASFCHVDMASDSDNQLSPDKLGSGKKNTDCRTYSKLDNFNKSLLNSKNAIESPLNEISSTNITTNEVSSSSDEGVPENNETRVVETDKSCDKENTAPETEDNLKIDVRHDDQENDDKNEILARCEQVTSEDEMSTILKSTEKSDSEGCSSEAETDIKEEVNLKNSPIVPCYIVLNRVDGKVDENKSPKLEMDVDQIEDTNEDENVSVKYMDETEEISANDTSSNINDDADSSSNLKTITSLANETCMSDTDVVDSSIDQESNPVDDTKPDDLVDDKECINSDDQNLNNESSMLVENGFENKEINLLDKSDESEDSDKLSVVLSEDGFDNDDDDSKTNEEFSGSGLENTLPEPLSCPENDSFKQAEVGDNSDGNFLYNGNESVDKSINIGSEDNTTKSNSVLSSKEDGLKVDSEKIQLASDEVTAMALTLEDKMDNLSSQFIIKECVRTSCTTCSYCSHAVKIGVNGKQLALHLLAEHRYMPVKNESVEDVIERLKKSLDELQDTWFNTDSYDSSDKTCFVSYDHTYECFQCNYVASLHKDLCSHKRKVHQKSTIYCCMCKANFHSYSELLCHMCPGIYVSKDIQFRCCFCELDRIPSAFRLMVHLRKSHHTCDICLEVAGDQQKLSTHMWKHKLHHLCYRCGISYRNKPDITKHLFWKHGTESVLCKKCLQKKWPHVYHFCIPPLVFICEECNLSFSKAVALKVHKRLHSSDFPYSCANCEQRFVAKKLLLKHEKTHYEATVEDNSKLDLLPTTEDLKKTSGQNPCAVNDVSVPLSESGNDVLPENEKSDETPVKQHKKKNKKDKEKKVKPVVDVYDLPPLNLSSESDDSDDEKEVKSNQINSEESEEKTEKDAIKNDDLVSFTKDVITKEDDVITNVMDEEITKCVTNDVGAPEHIGDNEENSQPIPVLHGIWDSFHSYKAEQEKRESLDINKKQSLLSQSEGTSPVNPKDALLGDHDYCKPSNMNDISVDDNIESEKPTTREHSSSIDHDYCTLNNNEGTGSLASSNHEKIVDTPSKKKQKSPKKKSLKQHNSSSSSDSSSDSDSSTGSCSCGTNCSCSSSSSNSSSSSSSDSDSSSSEGRQQNTSISKREKKRDKLKNKRKEDSINTSEQLPAPEEDPVIDTTLDLVPEEPLIRESDLETDETSTDEEFYDQNPQRLANQILAEKRNQLMGVPVPVNNGNVSPPAPTPETTVPPIASPINNSPKTEVSPPFQPVQVSTLTTTVHLQNKKKVKSKKRKKSQFDNRRIAKPQNLLFETSQPSTSFSASHGKRHISDSPLPGSTPGMAPVSNRNAIDNSAFVSNQQLQHTSANTESHSSKRHSKRRRIRNKFYGYSSEEDSGRRVHHHPPLKWKKPTSEVSASHYGLNPQFQHFQQPQQQQFHPVQPSVAPDYNYPPKVSQSQGRSIEDHRSVNTNDRLTKRVSTSDGSSSGGESDEVDSESDSERTTLNVAVASGSGTKAAVERDPPKLLYCYCQCPYDEVSEMIACDGAECHIEWFHFECVGIMVPPKGKWYCPDCRKLRGLS